MHIVFLDSDTLPTRPLRFDFPHRYTAYPLTSPAEVAGRIADADVVVVNKVLLGQEQFAAAPKLKLVALAATGHNNIDLAAAQAHGVSVCNVRGYGNDSVAEHAFMLLLALMRNLPAYQRDVAAGIWQNAPFFCHYAAPVRNLNGKTLAIVGRGNIGRTLAGYAQAFGMKVVFAERKNAATVRAGYTAFDDALQQADAVSLHCPLSPETQHLIGERELQMMKPQAVLINVGRGGLADESAVLAALKYGQLGGAGFDVLTEEPPRQGNPLLTRLPNLIVTPHVAWAAEEALVRMTVMIEDNINAFAAGRPQNLL